MVILCSNRANLYPLRAPLKKNKNFGFCDIIPPYQSASNSAKSSSNSVFLAIHLTNLLKKVEETNRSPLRKKEDVAGKLS